MSTCCSPLLTTIVAQIFALMIKVPVKIIRHNISEVSIKKREWLEAAPGEV